MSLLRDPTPDVALKLAPFTQAIKRTLLGLFIAATTFATAEPAKLELQNAGFESGDDDRIDHWRWWSRRQAGRSTDEPSQRPSTGKKFPGNHTENSAPPP